jgi:hypothetical protein
VVVSENVQRRWRTGQRNAKNTGAFDGDPEPSAFGLVPGRPRDWWATLVPGQHQWRLRIVRREQWIAAAMARSA